MARKLTFGIKRQSQSFTTPKPLDLWAPTRGQANIQWLPDAEFEVFAHKHGVDPNKGAFTVWGRWWQPKRMVFRATHLCSLIMHEARHVEEGHFHPSTEEKRQ